MPSISSFVLLALSLVAPSVSLPSTYPSTLSNSQSSLTLLYHNNLNASDDVNHIAAILLDATSSSQASAACSKLSERLLTRSAIQAHYDDFYYELSYLAYKGVSSPSQRYIIDGGVVAYNKRQSWLDFSPLPHGRNVLPVLCTQSANASQPNSAVAAPANEVTIAAAGDQYLGYRNLKSWRFNGVKYADQPQRWQYSTLRPGTGQLVNATSYGSQCPQVGAGVEDCLFLNIQTPYIPKAGSKAKKLRPVMFFIHGGGFNNGVGSSAGFDGGNMASREDIVVVTINYRLTTLGFLAIPRTNITGNYGIQDQITALQWVINNIAAFGGDASQIIIEGSSAGAGSVRVLLGSPPAIGKYQGAIAQSNLGGGVDLGLTGNYGTSYSSYLTVNQSYTIAGQNIFHEAGCNQTSLDAQIACLTLVDPLTLVALHDVANKVVQDGYIVNTEQLIVSAKNASTAHVPVIFGTARDDGAAFTTYPKGVNVTSEVQGIMLELGISQFYAQSIIDSGLFPYYDTGNVTLDSFNVSQRVITDNMFRCVDEATVYAGAVTGAFERAYYYTSERTQLGYDPNRLGGPPVTPGYPYGNPNLPYFRVHGSDQGFAFGNLGFLRDAADLYALQLETNWWAGFIKRGDPNQPRAYLLARGYATTIEGVEQSGPWNPVMGLNGPTKLLDWPSPSSSFVDVPQCAFLNYSLSYYLDSNRG